MSAQSPLLRPGITATSPGRVARVEYLGFQEVDQHREFRFRVYGPDESNEFRVRIANAAFDARRVRMQDGPDVCYQKLLRVIAAVEPAPPDVITIDDVDLFSYRDDHTPVPRRRARPASSLATPVVEPRRQSQFRPSAPRRTSQPQLPVAPLVTKEVDPAPGEGRRVRHAVFGMGVTIDTTGACTVVHFDRDGPKKFVTSLLELEVLSAPHTWETSARGVNRPCKTPAA